MKKLLALALIVMSLSALANAADDEMKMKVGYLFQPMMMTGKSATGGPNLWDVYAKRTRILLAGSLNKEVSFFADTNISNFGKATVGDTLTMLDAIATYAPMKEFKLDVGYFPPAFVRNAMVSAGKYMSMDQWTNASNFKGSGATSYIGVYTGRDTGLQFRGQVMDKFNYRVGAFQGMPTRAPHQNMRLNARVGFDLWDSDESMTLAGTYFGKKQMLSFGAGMDAYEDYKSVYGDVFFEMPMGTDAIKVEAGYVSYDGKTICATIPKHTALMAEAGYYMDGMKLSPVVKYEKKDGDTDALKTSILSVGVAYWPNQWNNNVKLFYTVTSPTGSDSYSDISAQWQLMQL